MHVERLDVAIATDGDGAFTGYTPRPVTGEVRQIGYVPDGTAPLATGADLAVTEEASGLPIVTKSDIGTSAFVLAPRTATHAVADGAALLYASGGAPVTDRIAVAQSRIKVVIAQGGASKAGTLQIWIG